MTTAVQLARELVAKGAIREPWVRRAFEDVPREVLVPRFFRRNGDGSTSLIDGADPKPALP